MPSAQSDATGNNGIINIITRKSNRQDYAADITVSITAGRSLLHAESISGNIKTKRINFFWGADYNSGIQTAGKPACSILLKIISLFYSTGKPIIRSSLIIIIIKQVWMLPLTRNSMAVLVMPFIQTIGARMRHISLSQSLFSPVT